MKVKGDPTATPLKPPLATGAEEEERPCGAPPNDPARGRAPLGVDATDGCDLPGVLEGGCGGLESTIGVGGCPRPLPPVTMRSIPPLSGDGAGVRLGSIPKRPCRSFPPWPLPLLPSDAGADCVLLTLD